MENVTLKVSELSGAALDWAVAKCGGRGIEFDDPRDPWLTRDGIADQPLHSYTPSTDWAQGGPIIERERLTVMYDDDWKFDPTDPEDNGERWMANTNDVYYEPTAYGPTPLIAAMRCYVASKLGDEVDIPLPLIG